MKFAAIFNSHSDYVLFVLYFLYIFFFIILLAYQLARNKSFHILQLFPIFGSPILINTIKKPVIRHHMNFS